MEYITGLLSALVLFQLQELWKSRRAASNLRLAVKTELEALEPVLSITLLKRAPEFPTSDAAVKEFKWIMEHRERVPGYEGMPEDGEDWRKKSDQELGAMLRELRFHGATTTVKIDLPVLKAALSSLGAVSLSANEIVALSNFDWQLQLLNAAHQTIMIHLPMSFTVLDPTNHPIVIQNILDAQTIYGRQLVHVLDCLRRAIQQLKPQSFGDCLRRSLSVLGNWLNQT